jgi:hypothetical protein
LIRSESRNGRLPPQRCGLDCGTVGYVYCVVAVIGVASLARADDPFWKRVRGNMVGELYIDLGRTYSIYVCAFHISPASLLCCLSLLKPPCLDPLLFSALLWVLCLLACLHPHLTRKIPHRSDILHRHNSLGWPLQRYDIERRPQQMYSPPRTQQQALNSHNHQGPGPTKSGLTNTTSTAAAP